MAIYKPQVAGNLAHNKTVNADHEAVILQAPYLYSLNKGLIYTSEINLSFVHSHLLLWDISLVFLFTLVHFRHEYDAGTRP